MLESIAGAPGVRQEIAPSQCTIIITSFTNPHNGMLLVCGRNQRTWRKSSTFTLRTCRRIYKHCNLSSGLTQRLWSREMAKRFKYLMLQKLKSSRWNKTSSAPGLQTLSGSCVSCQAKSPEAPPINMGSTQGSIERIQTRLNSSHLRWIQNLSSSSYLAGGFA